MHPLEVYIQYPLPDLPGAPIKSSEKGIESHKGREKQSWRIPKSLGFLLLVFGKGIPGNDQE